MSNLKIKFNFQLGGNKINKLEDIKENFFIDDLMDSYYNGTLVKWLHNNEYYVQREEINRLETEDPKEILAALMKILDISYFPDEIEEAVSTLDSIKSKGHLKKILGVSDSDDEEICEEEKEEEPKGKTLDEFVEEIVENHLDLNKIYDTLDELTRDYPEVLKENYEELFDKLHSKRPHTLLALFGHHATRPYYISGREFLGQLYKFSSGLFNDVYKADDENLRKYPFINVYMGHPSKNSGWTTIEENDKKFMLFYYRRVGIAIMMNPIYVAGTYTHHNEINPKNIPVELPLLEGLDVKSSGFNAVTDTIAYIEAR